jgi:putative oxidoreductase
MFGALTRQAPLMLAVLRIVAGLLFLEHGTQKLFGFPPGEHAGVAVDSLPWIAGLLEVVLGGLITIGLFTRPAAFIASGEMAAAYWIAHAPQDPFPANNGGDAAILFCFLFLYLVFAGAGRLSIDGGRRPVP